jgi:glucosamine--fructose-6-phosphate aminotransferase (isomerizing)
VSLHSEILEQPRVLAALLESERENVQAIARAVKARGVRYVVIAARGTSDNAGRYAKYVWGAWNRLPVGLAAPSLLSLYQTPPRFDDALVVGISQSGHSPDIVGVLREAAHQGALTLAITNAPSSPLTQEAELVLDTRAGDERAVAATKTYTTQLLAIAMLSAALDESDGRWAELERVGSLVEKALALDDVIERAAQRYRYMDRCVVLGRGYNYATAFEWSLKLKELTYAIAEPYSSSDFRHGPIAVVAPGFPILAVAPSGAVFDDLLELSTKLVGEHQVELLAISDDERMLELAKTPLSLPEGVPEWLSPIVTIVPAQLFCYHLTRAKGYDTDQPRGLNKVTLTL